MKINIGTQTHLGNIQRRVYISEEIPTGQAHSADVTVWVAADDSNDVLNAQAREVAIGFLERAIAALRPAQ